MANYTITAANVAVATARSRASTVQAGEVITAGEMVYLDSVTQKYKLALATAEASAEVTGISISGAASDGYFLIVNSSTYIAGTTLVAGDPVFLSATAGAICPHADLIATNYITQIGIATSTTEIAINLDATGIAKA